MRIERISSSYIHKLQATFKEIDDRGICIDLKGIDAAKELVKSEINRNLAICSAQWNCYVYVGRDNSLAKDDPNYDEQVNLNSSGGEKALLLKLKQLGYKVPTITKRNEDTGEYESKYSSGELTLQKMLVTNQFGFAGGDPAIRAVLQVRELTKLQSSYLNCRFYPNRSGLLLFLSHYNAAGTITGRRSSKKHTFGFGNNAQNIPKHGKVAELYRRCLISRPGNIFLMVDQKGAEMWPVAALSKDFTTIQQLQAGENLHIKRASKIFMIPENSRTNQEWKDSNEYYLGKKCNHAANYGMKAQRMSDSLAAEGHSIPVTACKMMLDRVHILSPNIEHIFHKYVRNEIMTSRLLNTPFGRQRQFLGMRPNDSNYKLFNEAFSYIPQATVGDNTGFAVAYMENESKLPLSHRMIVQENHDSIVLDIPDNKDIILAALKELETSFKRVIRFHNDIELEIPIEAEIGYNFADSVKIKSHDMKGIENALWQVHGSVAKE